MGQTIHRNFKQVGDAESARSALLAAGFSASAVQLNAHTARPGDASTNAVSNVLDSLTPKNTSAATAALHPACLLSVDTDDQDQLAQAETIMAGYGATEA